MAALMQRFAEFLPPLAAKLIFDSLQCGIGVVKPFLDP